ncbi:hypothetical protein ZIOFF_072127 [Zingiber officinale]|uniref:Uncharacterized protein n=1 Tax=Zingiber officinale TaxID=94328 RepID=A0A8J5CCH1_ZINOF|nr:hypothetical protein ZIOFF_072127 [Zingiber officinale]
MAAEPPPPAEVGARGTIGSLVSQEIEYFRRLNPDHQEASTRRDYKQKPGSSREEQRRRRKKKKLPARGGFLPSVCSAVDVIDTKGIEKAGAIGYKNLRTDGKYVPEE